MPNKQKLFAIYLSHLPVNDRLHVNQYNVYTVNRVIQKLKTARTSVLGMQPYVERKTVFTCERFRLKFNFSSVTLQKDLSLLCVV